MKRASAPYTSDLFHPLPLAAVAVLAINDHLLKGSGLLPGWITGKLSDVAGLFFFPVLLGAIARGALRIGARREVADRRALAGAAIFATGVVFTLLKLHAPFNAWVESVWGTNSMDATDLWALPVLPLSAAFMLRGAREQASVSHAKRALDLAAVALAAMASIATSKKPEPQAPPVAPAAVAVAAADTCAALAVTVCERSASMTFVTVEAAGTGPGACTIDVTRAIEVSSAGVETPADLLPSRVVVQERAAATFALSFLRPVDAGEQTGNVSIRIDVQKSGAAGSATRTLDLGHACTRR